MRSRPAGQVWAGDGRRIVRGQHGCGSRLLGQAVPGVWGMVGIQTGFVTRPGRRAAGCWVSAAARSAGLGWVRDLVAVRAGCDGSG